MVDEAGRTRLLVVTALAALAIIWGTQYLVIRVARAETSPELAVVIRFGIVAVIGQALVLATKARAENAPLMGRIAIGVCQGASMLLLYRAERDVESAWASVLMALSPFFVVLFAIPLVPDEHIRPRVVAGLVVGFAGAVALIGPVRGDARFEGLALLIASAAFAGLAKVLAKRFASRVPPQVMLRDLGFVVVIVVLPFALTSTLSLSPHGALAHAYLGVVASAFATGVYFWLLRRLPVTRLAYLPFVSAAVGVAAGVAAGERLVSTAVIGIALVLAGGMFLVEPARADAAPRL